PVFLRSETDRQRPARAVLGRWPEWMILHRAKHRKHFLPTPPRVASAKRVIGPGTAAGVDHTVYHSGATQRLASNPKFTGVLSAQRPSWVVVGQSSTMHSAEEAFRNVDERINRRVTQFHQKDS